LEDSLQKLSDEQIIEENLVNIPVIYDGEDLAL